MRVFVGEIRHRSGFAVYVFEGEHFGIALERPTREEAERAGRERFRTVRDVIDWAKGRTQDHHMTAAAAKKLRLREIPLRDTTMRMAFERAGLPT